VHDDMTDDDTTGDDTSGAASGDDLIARIGRLEDEARARLAAAATLDELRAVESEVAGRRSPLTALRKRLGGLDAETRRTVGKVLNAATEAVAVALAEARAVLEAAQRAEQLLAERLDLTEVLPGRPAGHLHLVTQAIEELEDVFVGMGYTVAEGPEVETDWHNFGALNFPPDHPARDMYDTLYVDYGPPGSTLLRTHTSPVQVRVMTGSPPPHYAVMPGRTFRSDTADATHMPVFHQIEGLVIDHDITFPDLAGTIDAFTKSYFGGDFTSRLRPSYFPFTEPSAEFDIQRPDGTWLELGGCGMVHPNVLVACGLDPDEWQGFAFGFGIDRLAAARHGVADLRDLFTNDIRFLTQF
jgi:phenylalanyl-tRNA synthetase alpha chain